MTNLLDTLDPKQDRATLLDMAESYAINGNTKAPYQMLRTANAIAALDTTSPINKPVQPDQVQTLPDPALTAATHPEPDPKPSNVGGGGEPPTLPDNLPVTAPPAASPDTENPSSEPTYEWVLRGGEIQLHYVSTYIKRYVPKPLYDIIIRRLMAIHQAEPHRPHFSIRQLSQDISNTMKEYNAARRNTQAVVFYLIHCGAVSHIPGALYTKSYIIEKNLSPYLAINMNSADQPASATPEPLLAPAPTVQTRKSLFHPIHAIRDFIHHI